MDLRASIQNANRYDTLMIPAGNYSVSTIIVDKPLSIIGEDFPVFTSAEGEEILTIISDSVHIEGLVLEKVTTSFLVDRAAVRVKESDHFSIKNNRLRDTFFGIYLENSSYGEVSGNEILGDAKQESSSGNAIHAWYCHDLIIANNEVAMHRDGIYFEFVDNSLIEGNNSHDNLRYGLHFMFSNHDEYIDNVFMRNGAGVAVMFSKFINMYSNKFQYNWGNSSYGLLLKEIYDAEIADNVFEKNTIGIFIEGSTRIDYRRNDFVQNGWALKFSGGTLDNRVRENNFISNTFDLSVGFYTESNSFDGNYWSDYNGYDLDKNGVGDVPHRPVKLFNFLINSSPESVVLLRSFFVELLNFAEKISPVFTPAEVMDNMPLMEKITLKKES